MRGSQFLTLVTMLRDELRRSHQPSVSSSDISSLKRTINRNYEFIYADYDWPVLQRVYPSQALSAGQYLYNFPDDLDPERVEKVAVWYSSQSCLATRGIGFEQYNIHDTEDDERSSPVTHWDVRSTDFPSPPYTAVQYEVWPIPDDTAQYIQFIGYRKFTRLVNDIDLCLLDDNLVVAFSAAELLAAQGSADAEAKLRGAQALYLRLRGRLRAASRSYALTDGGERKPAPKVVVQVGR